MNKNFIDVTKTFPINKQKLDKVMWAIIDSKSSERDLFLVLGYTKGQAITIHTETLGLDWDQCREMGHKAIKVRITLAERGKK